VVHKDALNFTEKLNNGLIECFEQAGLHVAFRHRGKVDALTRALVVLVLQPCVPQHERVYWGEEYCLRALNESGGTLGMPWVLEGDAGDCGAEDPPPGAEGKAGAQAQAPWGRPFLGARWGQWLKIYIRRSSCSTTDHIVPTVSLAYRGREAEARPIKPAAPVGKNT
jgi:hypothetical protein